METIFWNNKNYVEDWLNNLDGFKYKFSAKIIGRGHRGIEFYIFDIDDINLFLEKYRVGKSKYANFYLTPSRYTKESPFYVSIKKFK